MRGITTNLRWGGRGEQAVNKLTREALIVRVFSQILGIPHHPGSVKFSRPKAEIKTLMAERNIVLARSNSQKQLTRIAELRDLAAEQRAGRLDLQTTRAREPSSTLAGHWFARSG